MITRGNPTRQCSDLAGPCVRIQKGTWDVAQSKGPGSISSASKKRKEKNQGSQLPSVYHKHIQPRPEATALLPLEAEGLCS